MAELNYTKSEWITQKIIRDWLIESEETLQIIATVNGYINNEAESDANAQLISASPDMYEALMEVLKLEGIIKRDDTGKSPLREFNLVRNALMKAKGVK